MVKRVGSKVEMEAGCLDPEGAEKRVPADDASKNL
jgi:hypothetical protein